MFFIIFGIIELLIDSGEKPAFIEYPAVSLFLFLVLLILISIEAIVGALENVMLHKMDAQAKAKFLANRDRKIEFTWLKNTYIKLLGSKPIEDEGEIILDHNYDGIKELDNTLPPWWVYMFYLSIFFAVFYLLKYEVFDGESTTMEYETEVAKAKIDVEEYKRSNPELLNAENVVLLTEESDLKAGKSIFDIYCVVCHKADGGGGIGPNLTDEIWILGGGIKNVFTTISEGGRDGKGMVSWKQDLNPQEIAQVSSYVLGFQGTTPAEPKAAEGDVWIDPEAAPEE